MEKQEEISSNEESLNKKGKKQRDCLIHLLTGQEFRCQVSVSNKKTFMLICQSN